MKNRELIYIVGIAVLIALLFSSINKVRKEKIKFANQEELCNAITGELKSWKTKDSLNAAKIQVMQTDKAKDFLKIENLTGSNLNLQNLIKYQDKKIKDLITALIIESETTYTDTLRIFYPIGGDTVILSESVLIDSVHNEWINSKFGFNRGFSYLDLKVNNKYELTIGFEGGNIFKRGLPYANLTNLNPYTATKDMRVYQIKIPKQKRYGIGLQAGFGGVYDLRQDRIGYGPYIGIGINYNIINW